MGTKLGILALAAILCAFLLSAGEANASDFPPQPSAPENVLPPPPSIENNAQPNISGPTGRENKSAAPPEPKDHQGGEGCPARFDWTS